MQSIDIPLQEREGFIYTRTRLLTFNQQSTTSFWLFVTVPVYIGLSVTHVCTVIADIAHVSPSCTLFTTNVPCKTNNRYPFSFLPPTSPQTKSTRFKWDIDPSRSDRPESYLISFRLSPSSRVNFFPSMRWSNIIMHFLFSLRAFFRWGTNLRLTSRTREEKSSPMKTLVPCSFRLALKGKSKVFKYAKWPSKWLTNESLVSDLIK